jgi:hypothetical protein
VQEKTVVDAAAAHYCYATKEVTAAVVVVAVVRVDHVALSKHFLSWLIERAADGILLLIRSSTTKAHKNSTHRIFLDAISNALDNILYYRTMIALWLVIAVAHHAPTFTNWVPTYFDNAVVDLFAIGLHAERECNYSSLSEANNCPRVATYLSHSSSLTCIVSQGS